MFGMGWRSRTERMPARCGQHSFSWMPHTPLKKVTLVRHLCKKHLSSFATWVQSHFTLCNHMHWTWRFETVALIDKKNPSSLQDVWRHSGLTYHLTRISYLFKFAKGFPKFYMAGKRSVSKMRHVNLHWIGSYWRVKLTENIKPWRLDGSWLCSRTDCFIFHWRVAFTR